jgi:rubrerythrin
LRELYSDIGTPQRGEDTQRAINALETIRANCDKLIALNPDGVVEKALTVAIRVEERESQDIYPHFRDQALEQQDSKTAEVYQRVIDSETQHANWFQAALAEFRTIQTQATA